MNRVSLLGASLISKGVPAGSDVPMLNVTIHPSCYPMDLPLIQRQTVPSDGRRNVEPAALRQGFPESTLSVFWFGWSAIRKLARNGVLKDSSRVTIETPSRGCSDVTGVSRVV